MKICEKTRLVQLNKTHLEMVLKWRNQESIRKYMFQSGLITLSDHMAWFKRLNSDPSKQAQIFYLNDVPCGFLQINIMLTKKCEWGLYIGNQSAPKGAGTIMGYLALNYIFDKLCLENVNAEIIKSNQRSISYHNKLGFKRKNLIKGESDQIVSMTISKQDWTHSKEGIKQFIGGLSE